MPNIKEMSSQYENQDSLKNQPFYNEETEQTEKNKEKHKKSKKQYTKNRRNKLNTKFSEIYYQRMIPQLLQEKHTILRAMLQLMTLKLEIKNLRRIVIFN